MEMRVTRWQVTGWKEIKEECEGRVCVRLDDARMSVRERERTRVSVILCVSKGVVTAVVVQVVGYRAIRVGKWEMHGGQEAVGGKKKAYKETLRRNVDAEIKERRRNEK